MKEEIYEGRNKRREGKEEDIDRKEGEERNEGR